MREPHVRVVDHVMLLQCFGHSWYLAIDMQLFVISPLFIVALYL